MPVALGLEKITEESPEYLGLENVVTDEMAEVAVVMDKRVPITAAEVAKKCGKPLARTEELLEELALRGVIEYNRENEDHHKQYVLPMFVPGSAEYMNMNLDTVTAHPEVATMFERMSRLTLEKITPMVPPGGAGIGMHVVPVEKAIPSEQKSVDLEHLSHWLDKYDGKCAVGACSCRRSRRVRDEGCGHLEEDMCIAVGDMATYAIETNKARPVTREEVMEILQRAEDNGFVHQITNIDGKDKILGICNCCVCSCYALRTSQLFSTPNMSASAYRAHVDPEKCVACGQCAEVCPAGSAKLGQKLCTKDGPIVYPKQVLPDETKWGQEMWNENYRDDNPSANCYDTGTAPCKSNCPAHIAVQGYIRMAAEGRYMDALKLIKKENPFPTVCGGLTLQTAQPDIFVGGDVATGPKFAIDAIAAGKEAAISLHRYVHEGQSLMIGRNRRSYPELDKRNVALPTECFDAPARQVPAALPGAQARKTFRDPRCTSTEEQVKMEASRCLGCGVSVVDTNRCLGCGVCTTKCEFDAIHLRRDHPEATKMIRSEDKMKAILPYIIKRAAKIKVKELRSKHS